MLSIAEIKKFIEDDINSDKKKKAAEGQRYYDAEHDILKHRLFYFDSDGNLVEDTTRANIKISHPFFMILSDQLSSYMMSFEGNAIRAKESADKLQEHLDHYFDDEFWQEIGELINGAYNKGFEYLYAYKNAEDRLAFECADCKGVVEVMAKDADDNRDHIIYWYVDRIDKGKKEIRRIQDWSAAEGVSYYVQIGKGGKIEPDDSAEVNPRPHVVYTDGETGEKMGYNFGFIPFWRLDNNKKQISGLKPVKPLIDDYDLHACSLSNNLTDFDTPLHVVKGFQGTDLSELQQNLKTKKVVGVDSEGGIEVKTVDVPYQARKEKLDIDKENIFTFGMGFNPAQVGDGNITNVVIKSRYTLLDLKANKMQDRLCALLKKIIKVVLDEINEKHKRDYQLSDVYFEFSRSVMTNETENIQNAKTEAETKQVEINTILNAATVIGDEKTLQLICESLDIDYEEIKDQVEEIQEEQKLKEAKKTLEGVLTDDEEDPEGAE